MLLFHMSDGIITEDIDKYLKEELKIKR